MITIAAPKEPQPETRVAIVPDIVQSMVRAGHRVLVEAGAGVASSHPDSEYEAAGAEIVPAIDLTAIDVLAHVTPLPLAAIQRLRPGAVTIGLAGPYSIERVAALAAAKVTAMSFEKLPRTSRAQSMDALSSQALSAGYRCVLEAAIRSPRFFPMSMTAAGTVPPAKAVVLGIGVAGLQAIATARRLGATVAANDIRPSSAEEAQSVGATFIEVPVDTSEGTGTGGYARALGDDAASRQREALKPWIADADVLITTAAIPGRAAPRLVTHEMVEQMRPGAVVVDLAAPTGGNVEGSKPGEDVRIPSARGGGEITIVGIANAAADLPTDSSRLYSKNVENVLKLIAKDGGIVVDFADDIVDGMTITHDGVDRMNAAQGTAPASAAQVAPGGQATPDGQEAAPVAVERAPQDGPDVALAGGPEVVPDGGEPEPYGDAAPVDGAVPDVVPQGETLPGTQAFPDQTGQPLDGEEGRL